MKITKVLYRESIQYLRRRLYESRGHIRESRLIMPEFISEKGIRVVEGKDLLREPDPPKWSPPSTDDPRFMPDPIEMDHPDYHEETVYEFSNATKLIEGLSQALILTKSQPFYEMPTCVQELIGKIQIPNQDELVQRYIMQANVWDPTKDHLPRRPLPTHVLPNFRYRAEWGIPKEKRNTILLKNLIRLSQTLGGAYPDLITARRLSVDHAVKTHVYFQGKKQVHIKGQHKMVLSSDKPLEPFGLDELVDASVTHKLPDIFPVLPTIDLKHQHIWNMTNSTGWKVCYSHSAPHTIFHCVDDMVTPAPSLRNTYSLMFSFANAVAYAKEKFGNDVRQLREPISVQCVLTDGERFDFTYFQLNTTDFEKSNEGVKNLVWFDTDNLMYKKVIPDKANLRFTKYKNYDPKVFHKFLATYLNNANLSVKLEDKSAMQQTAIQMQLS